LPPPRKPPAQAAEALIAVAPLASRWIDRLLSAHEPPLTLSQYLVLRAIDREPLTAAEIARREAISGPAVSQLLAGLSALGWLRREPDPADRRHHALSLAPAGAAVYASAHGLLRTRVGELLAELPRPEADALARLLPHVEATLAGVAPPRRPPPPHRRIRRGRRVAPHACGTAGSGARPDGRLSAPVFRLCSSSLHTRNGDPRRPAVARGWPESGQSPQFGRFPGRPGGTSVP
jgi:DNA-binding MarR family transcriptional regulator